MCSAMKKPKQMFIHKLRPKEASFPSIHQKMPKMWPFHYSTIPFHHSIPVEHPTNSIPPRLQYLLCYTKIIPIQAYDLRLKKTTIIVTATMQVAI